jgi:hypothetical protein
MDMKFKMRDIEARTRTIPSLFGTGYADIQTYAHTYMDMHMRTD